MIANVCENLEEISWIDDEDKQSENDNNGLRNCGEENKKTFLSGFKENIRINHDVSTSNIDTTEDILGNHIRHSSFNLGKIRSSSDETDYKKEKSDSSKILIRQDSIHGTENKVLKRQNSLHENDVKSHLSANVSNERSLSWDDYVENCLRLEESSESTRRITPSLSGYSTDISCDEFSKSKKSFSLSESRDDSHNFRRNISKSSSKNTRYSSDVSEFSFDSHYKQSFSLNIKTLSEDNSVDLNTYQSHYNNPYNQSGGETSSGIKSITDESVKLTSECSTSSRNDDWLVTAESSDDPYEYDDEIPMEMASRPTSIDEELMLEVICSERVSQMSKTYNDIEAVTRLLEEKEKDLELTARIGKELLAHNNKLESNVAALEAELKAANDKLEQVTHELLKKTELIQVLTNDTDESGSETGTPTGLKCINLEFMQRRIKSLEDENKGLRKEFSQLAKETENCEEQEQRLVKDITIQLAHANVEVEGMSDDLEKQKEENRLQYEQIVSLNSKLQDTEAKLNKYIMENEELTTVLSITKENQNTLAQELVEFKDRYTDVMNLLQDTQEQLRRQRKKSMPTVRGGLFSSMNMPGSVLPCDSLANELESSLYSELSLDSGISADRVPNYKKVFETVKYATRNEESSRGSNSSSPALPMYPHQTLHQSPAVLSSTMTSSISGQPRMSAFASYPQTNLDPHRRTGSSTVYSSMSFQSLDSTGQSDTESVHSDDITYPCGETALHSEVPGSAEIANALKRLTPAEVNARRAALSQGPPFGGYGEYDATIVPLGCRTPDSIMSTGSSGYLGHQTWRLPDKLQIVKPLEGSQTLHHWSRLATPTLSGLLEERPGVKTKGGRGLEDIGLELYTLSDLEEDDEYINPGKSFQDCGSVYTYTNSTVMHPDDMTSVTHSLQGSKVCTVATNSRQSTAPPTPRGLSRRNSCSTFSTTFGLAKMLNERGIEAVTASALNTPCCDKSFSPTATPANSPDGSPIHSRSPSPTPYNPLKLPGFLTSGAELLRRTFISDSAPRPPGSPRRSRKSKIALSRSDRKALSGIRIVDKLERIGLDNIMTTQLTITQPILQGALYTKRSTASPMAQLTSLKGTISSPSIDSDLSELSKSTSAHPRGELGVPGRPGSGILNDRVAQLSSRHQRRQSSGGTVRPDLGTVLGTVTPNTQKMEQSSGALGTISSMLFGRKGGLL